MIRSTRPRLQDIDENITLALDLIRGRTLNHLTNDSAFRYALQFAILVIAEACPPYSRLNFATNTQKSHGPTSSLSETTFGTSITAIDPDVIWNVATMHLKPLHAAIKQMLADPKSRVCRYNLPLTSPPPSPK